MSPNVLLFTIKYLKNNSDYILSVILILFFGVEFYSKICEIYFNFYPSQLSQIVKGFILLFLSVSTIISKDYRFISIILILFGVFCLGQFYLLNSFSVDSILVFFRYLFPLLLFNFYNTFRKSGNRSLYLKLFETIIVVNSLLIIIGFLFSLKLFETYNFSRFGYNGLIYASATGSYLYLVALFYFASEQSKEKKISIKLILIVISCCLIGTKSIYISLVVLLFYFVFKMKSNFKIPLLLFLSLGTIFFAYFLIFKSQTFSNITANNGLATAVLSYRNEIFTKNMLPFITNEWSLSNYLFGGFSSFELRSQMGFIDLFFMFGAIGFLFYARSYFKLYLTFKLNVLSKLFLVLLIFMIFISGNFYLYSITSLFLIAYKENVLYSMS